MAPDASTCMLYNAKVIPSNAACPRFVTDLFTCSLCGSLILPTDAIIEHETNKISCGNCQQARYTCQTCAHGNECAFMTDPSPIPKKIRQTIQKGPMTTIADVPNPSRIAELCEKKCPCFDPEIGCLKQSNTCGNYAVLVK
jgi:hypothetical protein